MADTFWYFVMVPMVYLALAWCLVGIVIKIKNILSAPKMPYTLRIFPEGTGSDDPPKSPLWGAVVDSFTMPSIRKINPVFWFFLIVFHIVFVVLVIAHLDLLPAIRISSEKSAHMIGYGFVGLAATICVLYFLFRRFRAPVREVSVPGDFLILFLLFCIMITGDVISWGNSWTDSGFVITKQDFGQYLSSLVHLTFEDPKKYMAGGHYSVIGTHVLLANLFFIFLPFSKMMHMFFAVPLNKLRRG
jgi:nitrate reductase gamma subunit